MNYTIQSLSLDHPALPSLLELAMCHPTSAKIEEILALYAKKDLHLRGVLEGDQLVGVIGFRLDDHLGTVRHLAIAKTHQGQGLGRALIQEIITTFSLRSLTAETDEDSYSFYKKCGFTCTPFQGPHNLRYRCCWEE